MSTGSGVGVPIGVPVAPPGTIPPVPWPHLAVPLVRYIQITDVDECAFWGVRREGQMEAACGLIWTERQRQRLADYLKEAQELIEDIVHYPLLPTYIGSGDEPAHLYEDEQPLRSCRLRTRWCNVLQFGVRAETVLAANAVVDHTADPAFVVVDLAGTDVDNLAELVVRYPGSRREITPSARLLSGSLAIIYMPRCRLVQTGLVDNPEEGVDYDNLANFQETVEVVRRYTDDTTQVTLVGQHRCNLFCQAEGCPEYTTTTCAYVLDHRIGDISLGSLRSEQECRRYQVVRLHYLAGATAVPRQMESAVVRLAHSRMPEEPCGCELIRALWKRDVWMPNYVPPERHRNPLGLNEGAWIAWQTAEGMRIPRMRSIVSPRRTG